MTPGDDGGESGRAGGLVSLSSSLTIVLRSVLPIGWAILLPIALLVPVPDPLAPMKWVLSAGLVLLLIEWAVWSARLKEVHAGADGVVISDRHGEVCIVWSQVVDIQRTWWGKAQFARLMLRTPSRLGRSVLFMLTLEPLKPWADHPAIRLVRDHCAAGPLSPVGERSHDERMT